MFRFYLFIICLLPVHTEELINLGTIQVDAFAEVPHLLHKVDSEIIQKQVKTNVADALTLLPGISSHYVGNRQESLFFLRGFDS